MPACALVAQRNFVLHHSRPDERADQIRNDVAMCCMGCAPPCGYCLKASMTAARSVRPVVYRVGGNDGERCSEWWSGVDLCGWIWVWVVLGLFTLTLVLSHQGRGDVWLVCLVVCPALWIDESLITLCQRVRFQRRGTLFLIILVPMNGRVKSAMTWRCVAWDVPHPVDTALKPV